MQHLLEASFSIIGVLFTIAKGVSVIKALIFIDNVVEPYAKRVLISERAELIRQHVFMEHRQPLKNCMTDQCTSL